MPDTNTPLLLTWQSVDVHDKERSPRWYATGGLLVLAFAAYGLFDGSWSTAILALMIGGVYFLLRNAKPRRIDIAISTMGIQVGKNFTQWHMIRDFWVLLPSKNHKGQSMGHDHPTLHLSLNKLMSPEILVYLDNIDPAIVRETLLHFLPERAGMEERLLDAMARILKL